MPRTSGVARISTISSCRARLVPSLLDGPMHPVRNDNVSSWMVGCKPTKHEGIWKTRTGYRVRVRAIDPRTGTQKERNREFSNISIEEAVLEQERLRAEIRHPVAAERVRVKYGDFAESLLKRKIASGELSTEKSQRTWSDAQDLHLLPEFEDWFVDAIKRRDVEAWKMTQGEKVQRGLFSPATVNGWLRVFLSTLRAAVADLELEHDPTVGVKPIDTSTWSTYTEEEPNSLTVAEVSEFMKHARELYPQHYAQLLLGLSTGRRPCELRPLRRCGPSPDVRWDESVLFVRRSQVLGEPVERTKTNVRLRIALPPSLVEVLRWHVEEHLLSKKMRESELLFPSRTGGYQSSNVLRKPIVQIATAAGFKKHLSPYFMRRTFQDLCRAAQVHDFVVRSISGHKTVEMHEHYSSVSALEVRDGLAKVVSLLAFKAERGRPNVVGSGDAGGDAEEVALDGR